MDTRIRLKQASSLATALSEDVALYVQDGQGVEKDEATGLDVVDIGPKHSSRLLRMTLGAWRMWRSIHALRPSIAHFHDPELIPVGLLLKLSGTQVIYDVHENVPETIMKREWLAPWLRKSVSKLMVIAHTIAGWAFDRIVVVTSAIAQSFPQKKTFLIQNFPIRGELALPEGRPYESRSPDFAYVGVITRERSALEMVQAMGRLDPERKVRLHLAGNIRSHNLQEKLEMAEGWDSVVFHGWVGRSRMTEILGDVRSGLVLFHPTPNHMDSQPNKLFEYMSAGLPVIASDFSLWRQIIEGAGCGLLVDPQDPEAIAQAMQWILDNPEQARQMGDNGKRAVEEIYNWEAEAEKLIAMYCELLANERCGELTG